MTRNTSNDLNDLPRMVPDRDDIAKRRGAPPSPPGGEPPTVQNNPRLWPIYAVLLLLIAGMGYGGYELWNSQSALTQAEAELVETGERLQELERQLSATDESLTMTDSAIQANFNNILGEIRKLWTVSDGRNLEWIRENQAAITALNTDQTAQRADFNALADTLEDETNQRQALQADLAEMNDVSDDVMALQAREEELTARLDVVTIRVEAATELTTDISQQFNQLDSDLQSLAQALDQEAETRAALSDAVSQLRSRVNSLESDTMDTAAPDLAERVDAIDNARSDTIQRLSSLQAQITELRNSLENTDAQRPTDIDVIEVD